MFKPQPLQFEQIALEPFMGRDTVFFHFERHTKGYFDKLNELIKDTNYEKEEDLHQLVIDVSKKGDGLLFNNAAQRWNHDFFWQQLTPKAKQGEMSPELENQIVQDFGSKEKFFEQFKDKATKQFGSGWCWVYVSKVGKLVIETTSNALTPVTHDDRHPILVCDVWEHRYYLDYMNERATYVDNFWNVVNWEIVNDRFAKATETK